jgi:DNA topoisomerase-1
VICLDALVLPLDECSYVDRQVLLKRCLISSLGNDDYAKQNKSYGLTTLRNPHVKVDGAELRFQFKGKSDKAWRLQIKDRRVA